VQGPGGNISIKRDGVLWVKASGTWLADAGTRDLFVPVDLHLLRRAIAERAEDPVGPARLDGGPTGLKPSIETTLHALLPHPVVVHVHSVATLALAIRPDGTEVLARCLGGLRWRWIPYHKPGITLTAVVDRAFAEHTADILVLAQHGLVVGARDADTARRLIAEIEQRIAGPVRPAMPWDLSAMRTLAEDTPFRLPRHDEVHGLATDAVSLHRAIGGSLYPDHVVFLGPAATSIKAADLHPWLAEHKRQHHDLPPLLLVEGLGALVRDDLDPGGEEMALCLALVLARVPDRAPLTYLSAAEVAELLDWDAERYRRSLVRPA
jgi:rhamnose utilization protein RhaD (predicted bifunctional aldolase and dehydrogenase)